jgi:branched-chain amino acid transport system substrate-binding protein
MVKKCLTALGAVLLAVAIAACGSSSKKSSSTTAATTSSPAASSSTAASASTSTATSTPTAAAASGAVVNLGAVCSCTGAQAAALARVKDVNQVWAKAVNAAGGINDHPVKVTVLDDGGNPTTALRNAKELVESDHIQALVGDMSLADGAFSSYIAKAGVPVIGGFSPSTPFLTNPDFYATGATLPVGLVGVAALAKQGGHKTLGLMYCSETPLCAQLIPIIKGAAQLNGLKFDSVAISGTAPSYAAPCLALKSKGVDALFVADNAAITTRVMAGCAQQGYKPAVVSETTTGDSTWLKNPIYNGALLSSSNPGYTDSSNPAIKEFLDALNKYDPSLQSSAEFSYDTLYPWIAGKLFEAAAKIGNLTPSSTPAQITAAMHKIKNETLGGLTAPLTVAAGKPVFSPCYYGVTIKNGAYTNLSGGKPLCLTAAQSAALLSALKG